MPTTAPAQGAAGRPNGPSGHKLGPFSVTTWAMIGVGVGVAWYLLARRKAANSAAANLGYDPSSLLTGPGSPNPLNAVGNGLGGGVGGTQAAYKDNQAWYQAAFNALEASGYDPLTAAAALSHYLAGAVLSPQEQGLLSLALGRIGNPPAPPTFGTGPIATPGGGTGGGPLIGGTTPGPLLPVTPVVGLPGIPQPVLVGGQTVPDLSAQVPPPVITPTGTTFTSFPNALPPPTQPVQFYNTYTGAYQTIQPGQPGDLGSNVWAALLASPYVPQWMKAGASNAFSGTESV